jgi:ribosome-associated translation inhibitor RaiA
MQIIISGRQVDLAEDLREHMEERFRRLARFDGGVSRI